MNEIYKQAVVASFKMVSRYAGEGAYYNYDKLSYYNGVTLPPPLPRFLIAKSFENVWNQIKGK